eukprot:1145631-Pelagomonas_calceolata.AAC.1
MQPRADDSEWRKDNYYSEYTKTNAEVHPHRSMTDEAKEHAFYKWMARQQLYYKDLMKVHERALLDPSLSCVLPRSTAKHSAMLPVQLDPLIAELSACAAGLVKACTKLYEGRKLRGSSRARDSAKPVLETLLGDGPLEQKREAVKVLRQLTAVVQPEMYKSHSQNPQLKANHIWCTLQKVNHPAEMTVLRDDRVHPQNNYFKGCGINPGLRQELSLGKLRGVSEEGPVALGVPPAKSVHLFQAPNHH